MRIIKNDAFPTQCIQSWSSRFRMSVKTKAIGPRGIQGDQQQVGFVCERFSLFLRPFAPKQA